MAIMKQITHDIVQDLRQFIGAAELRESFGLGPRYIDMRKEYRELEDMLYEMIDSIAIGIDSQF
jgi:hypothetical protein